MNGDIIEWMNGDMNWMKTNYNLIKQIFTHDQNITTLLSKQNLQWQNKTNCIGNTLDKQHHKTKFKFSIR